MGLWFEIMRLTAALNLLVLVGLGIIWGRNYLQFRSKHTLGLLVFSLLMFAENGLALYYFTVNPMHGWFSGMADPAELAMLSLRVLMFVALLFLAWVTWD